MVSIPLGITKAGTLLRAPPLCTFQRLYRISRFISRIGQGSQFGSFIFLPAIGDPTQEDKAMRIHCQPKGFQFIGDYRCTGRT